MKPTQKYDSLYIERLRKANSMPFAEKFLSGEQLFEAACNWTKVGIRADHPNASEDEVLSILKKRLSLINRMETCRQERNGESG